MGALPALLAAWLPPLLVLLLDPPPAGTISTVAGTGKGELELFSGEATRLNINQPFGVELGPDGALYICEVGHHRVLRLDPGSRQITTVAGNGQKGYAGDGGPAVAARLDEPYEVRFDKQGRMVFVEMVNAVVRKVELKSGIIDTVAGTGKAGFGGDGGPARKAELRQPHSIALDEKGNLYIADIGNHRIRRVDGATGIIETLAGNGQPALPVDGSTATGQPLLGPRALALLGKTLWIALREGHSLWNLDLESRKLTLASGSGQAGYRDGPAKEAAFNGPKGIALGRAGELFIADTENHAIRRLDLKSGQVTTVAGSGPRGQGYGGDGGQATGARLDRPHGIIADPRGVLYIGDSNNHRVRRVEPH